MAATLLGFCHRCFSKTARFRLRYRVVPKPDQDRRRGWAQSAGSESTCAGPPRPIPVSQRQRERTPRHGRVPWPVGYEAGVTPADRDGSSTHVVGPPGSCGDASLTGAAVPRAAVRPERGEHRTSTMCHQGAPRSTRYLAACSSRGIWSYDQSPAHDKPTTARQGEPQWLRQRKPPSEANPCTRLGAATVTADTPLLEDRTPKRRTGQGPVAKR